MTSDTVLMVYKEGRQKMEQLNVSNKNTKKTKEIDTHGKNVN